MMLCVMNLNMFQPYHFMICFGEPEGPAGLDRSRKNARPEQVKALADPTPYEVEEHESTGDVQYRKLCRYCVQAGALASNAMAKDKCAP